MSIFDNFIMTSNRGKISLERIRNVCGVSMYYDIRCHGKITIIFYLLHHDAVHYLSFGVVNTEERFFILAAFCSRARNSQ